MKPPILGKSVRKYGELAANLCFYFGLARMRRLCAMARGQNPACVLFFPDLPNPRWSVMTKVCAELGAKMTDSPSDRRNLAFLWRPATFIEDSEVPPTLDRRITVNHGCRDICKSTVSTQFERIFGYALHIDPLSYKGWCVQKSDDNARHDGRAVECPIEVRCEGTVYQKLVNNVAGEGIVEDLRLPVVGNALPFVYRKYRAVDDRFSNENSHCVLDDADATFSRDERERVLRFARALGIDYGELDILRDRDDGRIYIVDVNNTPFGPPNHLPWSDSRRAVRRLAHAVSEQFLEGHYPLGSEPVESGR